MRNPTFKVNVFSLVHNAALQEFQYFNLDLCLTNTIQQNSYIFVLREVLDRYIVQVEQIVIKSVIKSIKISPERLMSVASEGKTVRGVLMFVKGDRRQARPMRRDE